MSSEGVFSFPLELEREIFETTALQHANTIPALLRVCRRVHVWVEPLLYRIVVNPHSTAPIIRPIQAKPADFLRMAVQHLFITPDATNAADIILRCSGIHSLFLDGILDAKSLDVLDQMGAIRRLNFTLPSSLSGWAEVTFARPTFQRLTHLELFEDSVDQFAHSWHHWSPLASLPALTHLCLSDSISSLILSDVVAECAQLAVIVAARWDTDGADRAQRFAETLTLTDSRLVVMAIESYTDDWKRGAEGRDDFWVRAENFVARKQKGEIPKTTFFLDG
ncbi:hypothetical protein C8R46DRAFT_1358174 [Mycena filopes]|nr:hypothetical protein C8R46DRAFT_1358174 [Mycena filopes]